MPPKKLRFISTAALVIFGLVVATVLLARHALLVSQTRVSAAQETVAASAGKPEAAPQSLPPGTIAYFAKATTTALFLARLHLTGSSYMTAAEVEDAIKKANNGTSTFRKGETPLVPAITRQQVV